VADVVGSGRLAPGALQRLRAAAASGAPWWLVVRNLEGCDSPARVVNGGNLLMMLLERRAGARYEGLELTRSAALLLAGGGGELRALQGRWRALAAQAPPARGQTPLRLTRWSGPVRVALNFGPSVPAARQAADRARIASFLARLSQLTGLSLGLVSQNANLIIAITSIDERRALGPMITAALPQINAAQVAGVTGMDRSTYCLVWTQSNAATNSYERAFVYVPAEHPDLMRLACMHEEIAQALGLPNDSGLARPSIFNDDEEFALLTRQDELMLRMLYNPALRNGMTEAEARPIIEGLARGLLGGNT
jgi:hypothetical protein